MADETIASAVALPEQEERSDSRLKRRQSPTDDNESKRRRLSANNDHPEPKDNQTSSPTATTATTATPSKTISNATDQRDVRRKSGVAEERKRGQRLFGALLGTLSQSSSTAAQKRRADIEKKQQAKLRMQEEEYNELTRKKQEELLATRKKQQRTYDAQSMRLRHSNQLAMAHFLKTTTEPVLYYKPWELRPEEEDKIEQQIEDCKAAIAREVEEFEAKNPPSPSDPAQEQGDNQRTIADAISSAVLPGNNTLADAQDTVHLKSDTVGADTNSNNNNPPEHEQKPEPTTTTESESPKQTPTLTAPTTSDHPTVSDATNEPSSPTKTHNDHPSTASASHQLKSAEDDSGEVMLEDKEDTVIY
ncbi:hypothetical protein EMPG_11308 [Blastomyces silverae]|uniref:Pinin/SDK/MemA protein domain-containing protein n=1 Tax=Blastomyces silverae TaxID=2060906 RepID=A0A0H1BRW4_9EURO|nr:hypothetical protein EMPG_11308 [Blastomyces silverae]